ncbi:MAG: CHAT domain-containing protein [Roseiflexaceae bacterium]
MFSTYLDFEIIISSPTAAGYPVVVRGPGGDARGDLTLPIADPTYQALMGQLEHLDTDEAALADLGQILFRALFHGPIKEVYTRSQGVLTDGQGLRIKLNIAASEAMAAALPWEFLHDPDMGPLALLDAPIVRYLPQQAKIPTLQATLPLKILLTAAQTSPSVDVERELRAIEATLADLGEFVQVTVEPHLTIPRLQKLLREAFHVWHFVGHGGFDPDGTTGRLAFEGASGDVAYVSAPQLGLLFNRSSVRLIVLDACHSAQLATQPLRSVAPALIAAQIPAVVAMQLPVPEAVTRAFAGEFYQALAEGFPIDACVTEGRKAVMHTTGLGRADWGIPVVYTRASDGMLFAVPSAPKPRCPYPGMVPFQAADARFFYGRDDEIGQVLQRLRHQRLLLVVGPSGSGKSSLVRAGLLPHLMGSSLFPKGFWLVRELRPGARPLETLATALGGDPMQPASTIAALLDGHPPAQRLLLVVDQFEELFNLAAREEQRHFIAALKALRAVESCAQLIMMRADFYPDLMTSDLWPIDGGQRLEIAPLRGDALRQAIEQPAADIGVRLEPGLIDRLLADAADEPGVLPLVQETMVLLWDAMPRRLLPSSAYTRLGGAGRSGLAVAIAMKADATLADLTQEQQMIARRTFVRLIQFGEGRADTRRQQPLAALRTASDDPAQFDATLRHLTNNRLLTLRGEEGSADRKVDIAHEALIAGWPTLQSWLAEWRAAEQTRRRLEAKATEWVRLGCGSGGLLDAAELPEAEHWLAGSDAASLSYDETLPQLVEASRAAIEAEERAKEAARQRELRQAQELAEEQRLRAEEQAAASRRQRQRAFFLAGALVIALVAAVAAGWFGIAAQRSARAEQEQKATAVAAGQQAEHEATVALARQLMAQAGRDASAQPDRALLFSVEATNMLTDEVQASSTLLSVLATNERLLGILRGHIDDVRGVAFSLDGKTLASTSWDGTIRLWDVATRQASGQPLKIPRRAQLTGPPGIGLSVAFSPDGTTLASASFDGAIWLWDVAKRRPRGEPLAGPAAGVVSVVFSPDGTTLASAGWDGTIQLWDVAAGRPRGEPLTGHTSGVWSVAFSPDGKTLASASGEDSIRLWDVPAGRPRGEPLAGPARDIWSVAFSPDGKTLASAGLNGTIQLWDVASGQPRGDPIIGHTTTIGSLAFSPDGTTLASADVHGTIRLWDVAAGQPRGDPLTGHTDRVWSVAFSPDGTTLASASQDRTIRLWDVAARQASGQPLTGHTDTVKSVAFSPDGTTLASGSEDHTLRLWDVAAGQPRGQPLTGHTDRIWNVAFSPDGTTLASASQDGTIRLWDAASGQPRGEPLVDSTGNVQSVAFSPDGKTLVSADMDGTIQLWDVATRQPRGQPLIGRTGLVWSMAFSPDGKTLALASLIGTIQLWNVATGRPRGDPLTGHTGPVWSVAFSPDGKTLASSSDDRTIRLWNVATGRPRGSPLEGHAAGVQSVAFSPDGTTLASGGADGTIRLWDVATRQPRGDPLTGHTSGVWSVAFSPDGTTLASGSEDQTVRLWQVSLQSWIAHACQIAGRNLTQDEWTRLVSPDRPYHRTCPEFPAGQGAPANAP